MKKVLLSVVFVCISVIAFTQGCPIKFKRNNGQGQCGAGKMTMQWATCPSDIPNIDSLKIDGVKINVTVTNGTCNNGAVDYCVSGGMLPPAGIVQVYFSNQNGPWACFVPEAPAAGPLPVVMSSFYAKRNNAQVILNWKTEVEINVKSFVIEKQTATGFEVVGTVDASNNATGNSYSFIDKNTNKNITAYRIRTVDKDGSFTASDMRSVKGMGSAADFSIFPNPSTGDAQVTVSDVSEGTDVLVIDNAGRVVKQVSMNNTQSVKLNNLQKGMYMIRLVNKASGEALTKKLSVIN